MNKIKTSEPKPLWKLRCTLGEGTLWVSEHNSIYFVDIKKYIKKKIILLNKYKFEMRQPPHSRSVKNITSLSVFRGGSVGFHNACLLYTSPSPRDGCRSRMPSSA